MSTILRTTRPMGIGNLKARILRKRVVGVQFNGCSKSLRKPQFTFHATEGGGEESVEANEPSETPSASESVESNVDKEEVKAPEEEEMGIAGQVISTGFLAVLFAAAIFFTFSRQFLPDLVPLDIDTYGN